MVKTTIDAQIGNAVVANGTIGATTEKILTGQKPWAVYFYEENGVRAQILIINMDDLSQLPAIAGP